MTYGRWLAVTAATYAVVHHLGLLPDGLGQATHGTQIADWLDLLVPWLVLAPAAATSVAAKALPEVWAFYGVGAVAYVSGHGIHLAANSINNADGGETAHFWDEVVGHYLWYAGVAFIVLALAATMRGRPRPHPAAHLLALAAGVTWATNAVGADAEVFGTVVAVAFSAMGWVHRRELGVVLLTAFAPAAVLLAVLLIG